MVRLIVLAVFTLIGSACSRTELAYRNADWLLEYYAGKTVNVSSAQLGRWQPVLASTLQRHREEELPRVIAYLDLVRSVVRSNNRSIGAACLVDAALLLYQRHARLAVDLAVPLLTDLDPPQIRHLAEYLARRQQKAIKHYRNPDPELRKRARQKRFLESIERWTGELNDGQRQTVRHALERIPDLTALWLAHREQQTQKLLVMLETGTSSDDLHEYLIDWWVDWDGRSNEYRQQWGIAKSGFALLLDELGTTLTSKQRTTLEAQLADLRKDLATFLSPARPPTFAPTALECTSTFRDTAMDKVTYSAAPDGPRPPGFATIRLVARGQNP